MADFMQKVDSDEIVLPQNLPDVTKWDFIERNERFPFIAMREAEVRQQLGDDVVNNMLRSKKLIAL